MASPASLPDRTARAIALKIAGWSYRQIGEHLGITGGYAAQLIRPPKYIVTRLKKRANNCCERCHDPINGRTSQVHHVRRQLKYNSLDNLLYLCCICHANEHLTEKMNETRLEANFLGSGWSFVELADGSAHWIHKSGKCINSSRNADMVANRSPEDAAQAIRERKTA